jgi:hypothetical protein
MLDANFLQRNLDSSIVIFCNSRKQSQHFAVQLEKKLDLMKLSIDVVNINGSLDKIDKFWRIRLFCDDRQSSQGNLFALFTTNASNVVINKHSVAFQLRFEWTCNLFTYFQERERGSCSQGEQLTCIVYGDLSSNVYLRSQVLVVGNNDNNNTPSTDECNGYNSAISPQKKNSEELNRKKPYPLGPMARCSLQERTNVELHKVLSFFCLDLGCQHVQGELYLATGILDMTKK